MIFVYIYDYNELMQMNAQSHRLAFGRLFMTFDCLTIRI